MNSDVLVVASPTGVDVELAIAGPGSRAYAFIIDWHIRLVLVLAWYVVAALILTRTPYFKAGAPSIDFVIGLVPPLVLYFLYHPLIELAMRGQTPGKRMAGVRIVNRIGGTPSSLAILIRNAFRLIDSLPVCYGVGLVTTIFSRQRVRLGDLAAGTLLVFSGEPESEALAQLHTMAPDPNLDPATIALGNDLLLRWKDLNPQRRQELARDLLRRIDTASGSARDEVHLNALDDRGLQRRLRASLSGRRP
jgi:uncharacterized RDD family membrane protein YckC